MACTDLSAYHRGMPSFEEGGLGADAQQAAYHLGKVPDVWNEPKLGWKRNRGLDSDVENSEDQALTDWLKRETTGQERE